MPRVILDWMSFADGSARVQYDADVTFNAQNEVIAGIVFRYLYRNLTGQAMSVYIQAGNSTREFRVEPETQETSINLPGNQRPSLIDTSPFRASAEWPT